MMKYYLILFCVFTVSSAGIQDLTDFMKNFFTGNDERPSRARTIEELESKTKLNESAVLDFIGLVEQHDGYEAEEYTITTADEYELRLHRISGSPNSPKAEGKPVIYIQHGMVGSSDFFVLLGPKQALVFQLADAGYDVWIGNVRGNTYSRSHKKLKPEQPEFWDYSLDEVGMIDMAEFIDFVLEKTDQKKLTFIGYSMGTTLSYILLSSKPEYNKKINLLVSISPVAYFTSLTSTLFNGILTATTLLHTFAMKINQLNTYEVLPQLAASKQFVEESCYNNESNPCEMSFRMIAHIDNMNKTAIPNIITHIPAGTSYFTLKHYQQLIKSGKFQKYDYYCKWYDVTCPTRPSTNSEKYNQETPPEYDLSLITAPHVIFYAASDLFVPVRDVEYLKQKLNNDSFVAFEQVPDYNHLDLMWSNNAKELYYNRLIEYISEKATA